MRRVAVARLAALAALSMGACGPGDPTQTDRPAADVQEAPPLFGFGTSASPERIALWDLDVRPDGVGLPGGSGSVAQGAAVYQAQCVACHGPTGTEGPNDPLVGGSWPEGTFPEGRRTIGSYWPHASTIFDYVTRAMPQDRPGTLTPQETYAVVAWILHRNGIVPEDAVLDAASLPAVVMPAQDRFVPDDRRGGAEVR